MVYITGDLHGDISRFRSPDMRRVRKGDTLIVCGDFGFLWEGGSKEQKVLKKLGSLPYTVAFLDGAHENYDLLGAYPESEWNGGRVQVLEGTLLHLLRGEIYTIEGERFFVFGGGESRERDLRSDETGAGTWWEQEMPSGEEMTRGMEHLAQQDNTVEYILTHEPSGKANGYLGTRAPRLDGVNVYLSRVEKTVTFRRWFFGSLHVDKVVSPRHLAVFSRVVPVRNVSKKPRHAKA